MEHPFSRPTAWDVQEEQAKADRLLLAYARVVEAELVRPAMERAIEMLKRE